MHLFVFVKHAVCYADDPRVNPCRAMLESMVESYFFGTQNQRATPDKVDNPMPHGKKGNVGVGYAGIAPNACAARQT